MFFRVLRLPRSGVGWLQLIPVPPCILGWRAPRGNLGFSIILCEALNEHRTLNHWTELSWASDPVPVLQRVTPGAKSADFGPLFGHSAAEMSSWHLYKKRPRENRVIFSKSYRSRHGALPSIRSRDKFARKSGPGRVAAVSYTHQTLPTTPNV